MIILSFAGLSPKLFSIRILLSSLCSLCLSLNWISALPQVSVSAARQAGGEMTLRGENQKQLHLGRIGLVFGLFFTGGLLAGRGWQENKDRQDDADVGSSKSLRKSVASWEKQLSSITGRIQSQRDAERDAASICHTAAVAEAVWEGARAGTE